MRGFAPTSLPGVTSRDTQSDDTTLRTPPYASLEGPAYAGDKEFVRIPPTNDAKSTCDGGIVGETLSGGWGHRVDKSIALGMLRADLAEPGTAIEVEIFGDRFQAVVQKDEPLWDPKNERLRA